MQAEDCRWLAVEEVARCAGGWESACLAWLCALSWPLGETLALSVHSPFLTTPDSPRCFRQLRADGGELRQSRSQRHSRGIQKTRTHDARKTRGRVGVLLGSRWSILFFKGGVCRGRFTCPGALAATPIVACLSAPLQRKPSLLAVRDRPMP